MIAHRTALMAPLRGVLLAGCSLMHLSDTQQQELAADLVIAVGIAQDVTALLPLLGVPAATVALALGAEKAAAAALAAWQQTHQPSDALDVLTAAVTLYGELPTATAEGRARLALLLAHAHTSAGIAPATLAHTVADLAPAIAAQLATARAARTAAIQELRQ